MQNTRAWTSTRWGSELYYADDLDGFKRRWNHFNDLVNRYGKWLRYTEIGANSRVTRDGVHDPSLFVSGSAMHEGIVAVKPRNGKLPELTEQIQAEFLIRLYNPAFVLLSCAAGAGSEAERTADPISQGNRRPPFHRGEGDIRRSPLPLAVSHPNGVA